MAGIFLYILNFFIKFNQIKRTTASQFESRELDTLFEALSYVLRIWAAFCCAWHGLRSQRKWADVPGSWTDSTGRLLAPDLVPARRHEGDQVVNCAAVCCAPEIRNNRKRSNVTEDSRTHGSLCLK
jgi:hypothetical protein